MRIVVALVLLAGVRVSPAETARVLPGPRPSGEVVLPNGRTLTPAGIQTKVGSYPFGLALTSDGRRVVVASTGVAHQSLQLLDAKSGKTLHAVPVEKSWLGLVLSPDGTRAYLAGANTNAVHVFSIEKDRLAPLEDVSVVSAEDGRKDPIPSGLALSADGKTLWATRVLADDVVRVDLATRSDWGTSSTRTRSASPPGCARPASSGTIETTAFGARAAWRKASRARLSSPPTNVNEPSTTICGV